MPNMDNAAYDLIRDRLLEFMGNGGCVPIRSETNINEDPSVEALEDLYRDGFAMKENVYVKNSGRYYIYSAAIEPFELKETSEKEKIEEAA